VPESAVHVAHQAGPSPDTELAAGISETMQALAAESRVRVLYLLLEGERGVTELAEAAEMTPAAASQQLRILRHLRLVAARRDGRAVRYRLYDDHVASLLAEIRHHAEHAQRGWASPPSHVAAGIAPEG
jgi:DNA-binding transcriptional ArsR family regulator